MIEQPQQQTQLEVMAGEGGGGQSGRLRDRLILGKVRFWRAKERQRDKETKLTIKIPSKVG
jgi:hypothetical protein